MSTPKPPDPIPPDRVRLDEADVLARLRGLHGWRREGDAIARDFRFRDFSEAFAFMARVALLAERQDHHPDWSNAWNRVSIRLLSHDAGGVTARDFLLAEAIDRVAGTPG